MGRKGGTTVRVVKQKHGDDLASEITSDSDIIEMINSLMGNDAAPDLPIAWQKWKDVAAEAERFVRLIEYLARFPLFQKLPGFQSSADALAHLAADLRASPYFDVIDLEAAAAAARAATLAANPRATGPGGAPLALYGETEPLYGASDTDLQQFQAAYMALREHFPVAACIVTCAKLEPHYASLKDPGALSGRFLTHSGGTRFAPLPPPADRVNFKTIYNHRSTDASDQEIVLLWLHKAIKIGEKLNAAVCRPDVDVSKLVGVVEKSIAQIQKMPGMNRCGKAFHRIRTSIGMLETNFGDYYKDMKESGNMSMMMENFVLDVANSVDDPDPKEAMQFKRIIQQYKKMAQQHKNMDPRVEKLFAQASRGLDRLEKTVGTPADPDADTTVPIRDAPAPPGADGATAGAAGATGTPGTPGAAGAKGTDAGATPGGPAVGGSTPGGPTAGAPAPEVNPADMSLEPRLRTKAQKKRTKRLRTQLNRDLE